MAKSKDYFGFGRLVSIIFAIIPFTAWLFGIITRFKEGKPVAGIIRIFCGWFVWICDLIMMIIKGSILRVLNCQFLKKQSIKKLPVQAAFFVYIEL